MNFEKLPHWLQSLLASTGGGPGLFLVAFLDSSVLSFPVINDLLVVHLSLRIPARMPYYALMATLGSFAGCLWLFYMARKGGEVMFRRHVGGVRAERVRDWVDRNAFLSVAVPAILPPPFPFKPFVLAAGVFQVPIRVFAGAILLARGLRYFGVGFLTIRYGNAALRYLLENKLQLTLMVLAVILLSYLLARRLVHGRQLGSP